MDCFFIWLGKISLAVGVIQLLWWAHKKMLSWIWPSKKVWESSFREDAIPIQGDKVDCRRTNGEQTKSVFFMLKITKPRNSFTLWVRSIGFRINKRWDLGQDRVIDRIQFMQSPYMATAFPLKYNITISNARGIDGDWKGKEFTASIETGILVEFPHPIKVNHFSIGIIEPSPNTYWGFGRIDIREVRLFGRFWRHTI